MSKITNITSSNQFSTLINTSTYVIVDFYADCTLSPSQTPPRGKNPKLTIKGCGPCKTISPLFEQLAQTSAQPGKLAFAKVNTDTQPDVAQRYGVSA